MATDFEARRARIAEFDVRELLPFVRFGTASDRYAGWIGQIYPETYHTRVAGRSRKLGGRSFREHTLPIDSVAHYFEHFDVLELDFTFYRPLLEEDGAPSSNFHVLKQYAEHAPEQAGFFLKAPQQYFARTLRRGGKGGVRYEPNPEFLDAGSCLDRFLVPARQLLGDRLLGVIYEQEYQRQGEAPSPAENVAELDDFFNHTADHAQAHLELRSSHLLEAPYFDWLADRGLGFVFSHWTWLPPIREQWKLCGERFTAADRRVVARLLTPLKVKYADAYATAHPFDAAVPEITESNQARRMVDDAAALAFQGEAWDFAVNLIVNNRAWGNAPILAQEIAERILQELERRASQGD